MLERLLGALLERFPLRAVVIFILNFCQKYKKCRKRQKKKEEIKIKIAYGVREMKNMLIYMGH
ncbi:MAG: hypothetical protein LUD48_05105, partial [Prevotella sp.]|nr:hypothetical protein [Prevotella sp.]